MEQDRGGRESAVETRAGHVALVGRPNVGKSTLLNAFLGEKLSIVTPRAQTTREQVLGILTTDTAQAVFVDTPGLLTAGYLLQSAMHASALAAVAVADVVLVVLDAMRPDERPAPGIGLEALQARRDVLFVAVNKVDAGEAGVIRELAAWARAELGREAFRVSAVTGEGVGELREALLRALPVSPFLYPPDDLAVQPVRFFVEELIRETIFEEYEEEVPYSTVVRIEEFREERDPIYIRATIYTERESQKAIVIGRGGAAIRELGRRSREKVEAFLGARVYLDLWVKSLAGWRRKADTLRYLGFSVPEARD